MRISYWLRNLYSGFKTGFKESLPHPLVRSRRTPTASRVEPLEERWLLANWTGDIPNGTVWPAGQVQRIVGDVHIPAGSTLTIQAGAVVKFNVFANLSINVDGTLLAQGTAGQPIYFTSLRDDSVGGDTLGNGPEDVYGGQWSAVSFSSSSTGNVLDHVEVRYGGENTPGSLVVNGGPLTLTNSTLMSSSSSGVRIQNSNPTLTNVIYKNNFVAASMDLNSNPAISGATMTNNATNALLVDGGTMTNGGTWNDPNMTYLIQDGITVPAGKTLSIAAGQVVKFREFGNFGITVNGTLAANGTLSSPIYFTSTRDDTVGSDAYNNGANDVYGGQWDSLTFNNTSSANVLDHVEVRYGGENGIGAVITNGGPLALTNSTIQASSSSGVRIQTSNPTLTNVIYRNNFIAASMDLNSNPIINGVTMTNNATNALRVDGGTMTNGGTWNDPDITYLIQDGITVPTGKTLSIAAGQVVKFREFGNFGITVNGTLAANGTLSSPIYFTSTRDDTVGGDAYNNGMNDVYWGQWDSLTFNNTSLANILDHVEVRYGGENGIGAVITNGGALSMTDSTIQASSTSGIRIQNSNPILTNLKFKDNSIAASMDLASNPAISGVTMTNNGTNALRVDGGTMTNGGTWNDPDITYLIQDGIMVPPGKTLSIAAGQVVKFREFGNFGITVNGTLAANGTLSSPIYFTSSRDDTVGGDAYNNGMNDVFWGQWDSLTFNNTSLANTLDHVEVRYGGENGIGAVITNGGSLSMTDSTIQASSTSGIRIQNSNPILTNLKFKDNSIAASMDLASNPAISGVTMINNGTNALRVDGGTLTNGGTWNDPDITYLIQDGITVPTGNTLSIAAGQVVKFREFGNFGITVNGTLAANGTLTAPIYFTSSRDDTVGGDAYNNGMTDVYGGQWDSLTFNNTSLASVLDHVEFRYGGENGAATVIANGTLLDFTNGVIRNSSANALQVKSGATLNLENSVIFNNADTGLRVESGSSVSAINNTIDGNFRGAVADGAGTVLVLTNSLVTNSIRAGITLTNRGLATTRSNDVFNPTASDGNYIGLANATGTNGNVSVDPKYVNRASLDFHLQSTSPVIDAATSDNAPIDDFDFNYRIDNLAVANTGDGASPFFDMGAYEFGGKPRAVTHSPSGKVSGVLSKVLFTFRGAMDTTSFSVATDVISFTGPTGSLTVTGYQWLNQYQLEVTFNQQAKAGDYQLVLGPGILDTNGNMLDTDADGVRGESTDDRYSATWKIVPPRVVAQSPVDYTPAPVDSINFTFDRPMDQQSFSLDAIVSFTGPIGGLAATGFSWTDPRTLRVTFASQTALGAYEMVLGPNIADVGGNLLDQSRNGVGGEVPADHYTATFTAANIFFVSGSINQNTTWSGLIIVDDDVSVQSGVTLTINPGTIIKVRDLKGIAVRSGATLLSNGTTAQPIRITSIHDDTIGGDSDNNGDRITPQPGDWSQILNEGNATFDHTEILYGSGIGNTGLNSGAIRNAGGTVTFSNSSIRHAFYDGIDSVNGSVSIVNSVISGADRGVVSTFSGTMITIVNSTFDDNRIGILAHAGGAFSLKNSIVANSLEAGVDTDSGPQVVTNTDVYSSVSNSINYRGMANLTGTNGNISKNPKFVNSVTGNYRLDFGSPAIDAANGTVAPVTDQAGSPRYDDPRTENTGTLTPNNAFADMGAFEFVEGAPSDLDLIVTSASTPAMAMEGETVTVQWTEKNVGTGVAGGTWHDAVYLSSDAVWTPDDVLLGEALHNGDLGPSHSYTNSLDVKIPGVLPGDYYFLVRANSDDAVFEGANRTNNVTATSSTITLDVPTLSLGTPLTGHLAGTGETVLYKVVVAPGSDIRVSLDGPNGVANELYVDFGDVPTRQSFETRGIIPNQPDQTVSFGSANGGTYYVLVRAGMAPAGETFTVTATTASFSIASVFPTSGSNSGQVTLSIAGSDFDGNSQPRLIDSANNPITPTHIYFTDSGQLAATFDLTGHPTGPANVQVINTGNVTTTLSRAFNIISGQAGHLVTSVTAPSAVRVGRGYVVYVDYANIGDADLLAPVMRLQNSGTSPLSLNSDMEHAGNYVDLIGVGSTSPAGILSPGASGRIPVYVTASGSENFQLVVGEYSNTSIDWPAISDIIRPADASDAEWNPLFAQLQTNIGDTWDDFHRAISLDTSLLQAEQGLNYSLNDVVQIEINKAFAQISTSVSGRLFLRDTTHPLGNVTLQIYDPLTQVAATAVSYADGTFLFPFVASGKYQVSVSGFVITPTELVVGGSDLDGVDLVVTPAGTINGRVVRDTLGVPLADVLVSAGSSDGLIFTATTDASGNYTLTSLPPGVYEVRAGNETYTQAIAADVSLEEGEVRSHLDFAIDTGAVLRGTVSGIGGPISGASVVATSLDGTVFVTETNSTGSYELIGLLAGTYTVSATATGLSRGLVSNVSVASGANVSGINIPLSTAGTVEGTTSLLSNGSTVAFVGLEFTGAAGTFFTQSDTTGHFSLTTLPAGSYVLSTAGSDFMTSSINVNVIAGVTTVVPVPITSAGTISGQVTDSVSNNGIAAVAVRAVAADGTSYSTVTNSSGFYEIAGLAAGTYNVILGDAGTAGISRATTTLNAGQPGAISNFSIAVAGIVSGTAFRSNGTTTIPGTYVSLVQAGTVLQTMPTNSSGHFSFVVLASGTYDLYASADGLSFPVRTNVNITGGSIQSGLNFTAGTETIQGTVRNASTGLPIAGATVDISRIGEGTVSLAVASLTTALDGTFQLTGVVPGSYRLTARSAGTAAIRQNITVTAGTASNSNFQLGPETTVRGIVRDDINGLPLQDAIVTLSGVGGTTGGVIAFTDEAGRYELGGIPSGTYDLTVLATGHEARVLSGITTSAIDQVVDVDLNSASIHARGTVTSGLTPLGGIDIAATNAAGAVLGFATTNMDGTFEIDTLPPGTYTLTASGAGYRDSAPQPLIVAGGANVNGLLFNVAAVAIADPQAAAAPGSDLGLRDTINRILQRATQRTDHPNKAIDLLPYVVPGACVTETKAALDAIRMADAKLDDFKRVAEVAEGYGSRALETVALIGLRGVQFVGLVAQLQATLLLYSTELVGVAGLQVGILNSIVNFENNWLTSQLAFDESAKKGDVGAAINSAAGAVGLLQNINFGASAFLATKLSEVPGDAAGITNVAVGVRSIFATVALINTSARVLIASYQDMTRIFRSFEQFNNAAGLYDKAVDNAKQAIGVVKACNCIHDEDTLAPAAAETCNKPPEPKEPIGPPIKPSPGHPVPPNGAPGTQSGGSTTVDGRQSSDPNHKTGPAGFGLAGMIQSVTMPFKIEFENSAAAGATAAAQIVVISDTLDVDVDVNTLEFTGFGFGPYSLSVPAGLTHYQTTLDLRPDGINLLVPVTLDFNLETRLLTARFESLDPVTNRAPDDPDAGFLPVNNASHIGEGFFTYIVRAKNGATTGTMIDNFASIVFDDNAPILTPTTRNTLDVGDPNSAVSSLPTLSSGTFTVNWSGNDDANGSGIATYDIYVSDNNGPDFIWQSATTATSATYTGIPGHTYRFYSVAHDNVGHAEIAPQTADTTTTVETNTAPQIVSGQAYNVLANAANGTAIGTVIASDVDITSPNNSLSFSITSGNGSGAFLINAATGQIQVANSTALTLLGGQVVILQITVIDGGSPPLSASQNVSVTVTNVNTPPVLGAPGTPPTYIGKLKTPVPVLPALTVTDVDGAASLASIVISLTFGGKKKNLDTVTLPGFAALGTRSDSVVAGRQVITITLRQGATNAAVQQMLQALTFQTKGAGLKIPSRNFQVRVTDRTGLQSNLVTQNITVRKK